MNTYTQLLSASDWINIIGIIASFVVSVVSIFIAIKALCQNNKMLEETTRPYISIAYEVLYTGNPQIYLVVKNYGNTGAVITDFSYSPLVDHKGFNEKISKLNGAFIAPNQKFLYSIDPKLFKSDELMIDITYKTQSRSYHERQPIKIRVGRIVTRSDDTSSIQRSLQEISERLI